MAELSNSDNDEGGGSKMLKEVCDALGRRFSTRLQQLLVVRESDEVNALLGDELVDIADTLVDVIDIKLLERELTICLERVEEPLAPLSAENADLELAELEIRLNDRINEHIFVLMDAKINRIIANAKADWKGKEDSLGKKARQGFDKLHVIASIVEAVPSLFPEMHQEIIEDIEALRLGVPATIFAQRATGHHGDALDCRRIRLAALQHLAFRVGMGNKHAAAIEAVADAYTVDVGTVRKWNKLFSREYPWLERYLRYIRVRGGLMAGQLKVAKDSSKPLSTVQQRHFDSAKSRFGEKALREAGEAYKKLSARENFDPYKDVSHSE